MIDCSFFGEDARFHHVGLAVDSIRAVNPDCDIIANETQGVSMAFIQLSGVTIELLEPLGEDSPIAASLRKRVKLLHLCFEVPDVDEAVAACLPEGFLCIARPVHVPEFDNRRIAWVFSRSYGLVELLER